MFSREDEHYHLMNFSHDEHYHHACWLIVDHNTSFSRLSKDTHFVYSEAESITAGLVVAFESIVGSVLNLLVILALLKNSNLRKEYLTPAILSLALTDFLFSVFSLPVVSLHFFVRYEHNN